MPAVWMAPGAPLAVLRNPWEFGGGRGLILKVLASSKSLAGSAGRHYTAHPAHSTAPGQQVGGPSERFSSR